MTWMDYVKDDLRHLSGICRKRGVIINWWSLCKDNNAWTNLIREVVELHLVLRVEMYN